MMTPKQETVLVVLGLRMNPANPMPATIVQRKGSRAPAYQYLSPEQHDEMGDDQTAFWSATFLDGHYWLEHRLPDDARPEAEKKGFVVLHE